METNDTDEEDATNANIERNEIDLAILNVEANDTKENLVINNDIGLFVYTPKCFQKAFLSVYGLLFFLCCASTIQGATVNGLVNLGLSTLERRFNLKSVQTGFIAGSYEIGFMAATLPVTYFGGIKGASKPKYIAAGLIVLGTGSFLFSLPHFLSPRLPPPSFSHNGGHTDLMDKNLCNNGSQHTNVSENELHTSLAFYRCWFILGQILHGVGAAPILTLGITLLEESIDSSAAPLYIAIFQTFFVIGPALGYVIGGQFLELYVDFYEVSESPGISSKDPNWVGAWWLGFIFVWALSWICGIFLFLYPATLPNNKTTFPRKRASVPNSIENKCLKTYHNSNELLKPPVTGDIASSMAPKSNDSIRNVMNEASNRIIQLMSNPSYVLLVLGGGLDSIMVIGLGTFLPKFIMSQYGFSASVSAVIMGIIITPSGGLGTLTGGYLVKKFKMSREQILKMYIYCQIVAIPCLFAFVFYCEDAKFAGVNVSYNQTIGHGTLVTEHQNTWSSVNLSANCNANCGECGGVGKYEPVCGEDGLIYLNSCYAGCEEFIYTDNSTAGDYTKCSCVQEKFKVQGGGGSGQMEMCNVECQKNFFLLVSFLFIVIWVSLMSGMSCIVCIMRFVEPENKSLSMGIAFIIARLIGSIPGPVIFGYIIDQACVLETENGNCLVYNNYSMSIYMLVASLMSKVLGLTFIILTLFSSRWSKIKEDI